MYTGDNMKKSVVFGVLSKSPRFGRGIMVNTCRTRSVKVNSNVLAERSLLQILNRQKNHFTAVKQIKYYYSSDLAQRNGDSDSDVEYSKELDDSDTEEKMENRRFLYPDSQDPVILKLNECASVQAVFDIVSEHENDFNGHHASQALLVLWDLQKVYYRINKETHFGPDAFEIVKKLVDDYAVKVVSHPNFRKIVNCIEVSINELSPDALTCTFLYLKRMGIPFHGSVMQKLLIHIEKLLEFAGNNFSVAGLSRFAVAIRGSNNLNFISSAQKILPVIDNMIDSCESENDFEFLCVCLQSISWLISSASLNAYKCKVEKLIASGIFPTYKTTLIVRTASLFNNPLWSNNTSSLKRKLLLLLKGRISELKTPDVVTVHKIIETQLEPADLHAELSEHASRLLSDSVSNIDNESAELFVCVVSFCSPKRRKAFENITKNYLNQKLNPHLIASLFKILRYLKTANVELNDQFWSSTIQVMKAYPEEYSCNNIFKYSNRYMHFNNNLSGTYRHHEFESQLIEWYLKLYESDIIGFIPSKFAQMIGFLVAYGDKQQKDFISKLDVMVTRLGEMSSQLCAFDCVRISRGIQISSQLSNRVYERSQMYDIYVKLNSILNECIKTHIYNSDYSLPVTNTLMRSYVMRNGPQSTDISHCLVKRYENVNGSIVSRSLREASRNLISAKCLIPKTINYLTEFVVQNKAQLFGETVELILFLCYEFGYTPVNADLFLKASSEVIVRESERLPGLAVLQSSLALCFFHSLPEELVHLVFTIDFLERLDEEIANCYAKAVYPSRLRNYLMQLNRAVCLDYPEFDIPWFHKKYSEEIAATDEVPTSLFHNEVKKVLVEVLGQKPFITQHSYSPYGYRLDFEIFLNENNVPVSWKQRSDKNILRKAILLHSEEAFSNNVNSLNGFTQMKKRHLEMLGYEVIEVVQTVWNSMYMAEPGMKQNFIKEKVFKSEKEAAFSLV